MATELTNFLGVQVKDLTSDPSFDSARLGLSADPTTGKLYKVTMEQWVTLLTGLGVAYAGPADTTTDPGTPSSPVYYTASTAGTYTHFLDSSSTALVVAADEVFAILSFDGTAWSKQVISFPQPENKIEDWAAGDYSSGDQVNHNGELWYANAAATSADEPGVSDIWVKLTEYTTKSDISDIIGSETTNTLVVENFAESSCHYGYTTANYSGYGSPIGSPKGFNAIKVKIKVGATAITELHARVLTPDIEPGSTVVVLATKDITGLNISPNSEQYVTIQFDSMIDNASGDNLYFQIYGDQLFQMLLVDGSGVVFPLATYGHASTQTNGTLNFTFTRVGSELNIYTYISAIQNTTTPDAVFSDKVADASPKIQAIKTNADAAAATSSLVNNSMEWATKVSGATPNFDVSGATWRHDISTFSAWGSPIGTQQNFDAVKFRVRARTGNTGNITKVVCYITDTNKSGTILGQKEIDGLAIAPGADEWLIVHFDSEIVNSDGNMLCFVFACDNICDVFMGSGITSDPVPFYTTSGNITKLPSAYADTTTGAETIYVETGTYEAIATPTDSFISEIQSKLDVSDIVTLSQLISLDIVLPSRIFAVTGTETNVYWKDFIYSNFPLSKLRIDVTCSKGQQFMDFYRVTPVDGDAGSYSFQIDVYLGNDLIKSATSTLYVAASSAGADVSRKVICVGDSTTAPGTYIAIINTEHSGDALGLTFLGTQGTTPNNHEGRGGWRVVDYATAGRQLYKFNVSGVTDAPGVGSVYSDGTRSFTVTEVNISSGSGYFSASKTGTGEPAASGTLTKTSGSGDASVTYSSNSLDSANPFWNASTSALDFAGYLSSNSYTLSSGDWVTIYLGINDIFSYTSDEDVTAFLPGMITNLRNLISNMRSAVSGLRVAICITTPPASQDGFGFNYGTGQTQKRYLQNLKLLQQKFISEFDSDTERTNGNHIIPFNIVLDSVHNMQHSLHNANARNSTDQIDMSINGVHPANPGYYQLGDQLWAFLKNMA